MQPQVNIYLESRTCQSADVPEQKNFYEWAMAVIDRSTEVGLRIVDDREGRQLNRYFRGIDQATNVLSFPFQSHVPEQQNYLGDIVMTAPFIVQEAHTYDKSVISHWAHLFIHALLHLRGYRHDNELDARKMERRESCIMTALGFPDPWLYE